MTTPLTSCVRLHDPGELIAAVPHLLGFHPADSLVLITLCGGDRSRVGVSIRLDLPGPDEYDAVQQTLLAPVRTQPTTGVLLVVVGGGSHHRVDGPPHRALVEAVERALADAGMPCLHSVWTPDTSTDSRWVCYTEADCTGRLPDPAATALAAASAAAGLVTFADRTELAGLLDPDDETTLLRRAELITEAAEAGDLDRTLGGAAAARRDLAALHRALEAAERGRLLVDDELVVRLAFSLTDRRVRDACMRWCDGPRAAAAEGLWLALTKATPAPARAEPAALLALSAYLRGDGALASLALSEARAADSDHALARLLDELLQSGVPPRRLAVVIATNAEEALLAIESEDQDAW
ncbi:hypothetical protein FHR81_001548 [Actinoalloteichus hoggarensis]|uniref:Uncharacterized protein n=1 Tax=Actinoalloteichus hoggarensis TaxID=1470176 RepID=A0A221W0K4_9PSEU|nr:DUF4192 domain-containing protein [Actinoalloteichus hoggarensis]ASO19280.1 hypothetical protein AHOG_08175 [Actinoalloteichus hoggarensis]MBB5920518.1 hypothetical protein [Actinoalloteichus hoggarensis]